MASRNPLVSNQYTTVFVASQPIADMLIHFEIHQHLSDRMACSGFIRWGVSMRGVGLAASWARIEPQERLDLTESDPAHRSNVFLVMLFRNARTQILFGEKATTGVAGVAALQHIFRNNVFLRHVFGMVFKTKQNWPFGTNRSCKRLCCVAKHILVTFSHPTAAGYVAPGGLSREQIRDAIIDCCANPAVTAAHRFLYLFARFTLKYMTTARHVLSCSRVNHFGIAIKHKHTFYTCN